MPIQWHYDGDNPPILLNFRSFLLAVRKTSPLQTVAVLFAILIGSFVLFNAFSLPADNSTYSAIQNFGHFVLFAVLGLVFLKLILELVKARVVLALLLATGILVALGLGIELFQKSLDGRTASLRDLALDVAGMLCGYLMLLSASLWRQGNRGRCACLLYTSPSPRDRG